MKARQLITNITSGSVIDAPKNPKRKEEKREALKHYLGGPGHCALRDAIGRGAWKEVGKQTLWKPGEVLREVPARANALRWEHACWCLGTTQVHTVARGREGGRE